MATSPTTLTLKFLRAQGFLCQKVEYWNAFAHRRVDLYGIADICACCVDSGILLVQACAATDHAKRRAKCLNSDTLPQWLRAGGRFQVISWAKRKEMRHHTRKVWVPRSEELTLESLDDLGET